MDLNGFARHDRDMFAPYCPRHDARVLLGYESVVAVEQTPTGPKILLHCHCGELLAHDAQPVAQAATQPAAQATAQPAVQTRVPSQVARVNVGGRACLSPC